MVIAYLFVLTCYALSMLWLTIIWTKLPTFDPPQQPEAKDRITVVVPVRNEARNIEQLLRSIECQTLSVKAFEVVVVDDHSTDDTVARVEKFVRNSALDLKVIKSKEGEGTPKKRAIEQAIGQSYGHIIVTTDGDCIVGEKWLEMINQAFEDQAIQLVMGPVIYSIDNCLDKLQWVEFSALQGLSAVLLSISKPAMGNGANLAYRKTAFMEVGGFDGNRQYATGDDEFLVRKMAKKLGVQALSYLKTSKALVLTSPAQGTAAILNQKIRWSSKWRHQKELLAWMMPLLVLGINLLPILGVLAAWKGLMSFTIALLAWSIKGIGDMVFSRSVASYYGQQHSWIALIAAEIIYPVYTLFFGLGSIFGKYTWKDRRYNE